MISNGEGKNSCEGWAGGVGGGVVDGGGVGLAVESRSTGCMKAPLDHMNHQKHNTIKFLMLKVHQ